MAISDELSRIVSAKAAIKTALENKGLTIGDSSKLGEYPAEINKIDTSTLLTLIDRSITKITIPSGITSIGSNTFNQCLNLKDVSINSNITSIGAHGFSNCDALVQINIPSSVTSIETEAFSGNDRLYAVDFLGTPSITKLKLGTFYNCPQLTYIEIPESVTELEANVFQNCTSLTTIKIPSGVTKIGNSAFSGCSAMMHFVCMATTPPTISSNTFSSYHYSNVKLHVPASSVSAYQNASNWSNFTSINGIENIQFEDAKVKQYLLSAGYGSNGEITTGEAASILRFPKLTKPLNCYYIGTTFMEYKDMGPFMYKLGYNVKGRTDISTFNELKYFNLGGFSTNPRDLFYGTSLTSMELPDDIKAIPPELFASAYRLNHLIIPNTVTKIGYGAFYYCQNLKGLVIPASVTEIEGVSSNGDYTLSNVPQVTFMSQVPPTISTTHGSSGIWGSSNLKIYVPKTALQTYRTTSGYPGNNSSLLILPIVDIEYDSLTLTAQALGRPYGQEMYIDGSLINSSTYTFTPDTADASHVIMVKCVDPSLGVLDSSTMEVLVEGKPASILSTPHIFVDNTSISTDGQTLAAYTNENNVYVIKSVTNPCDIQDFPYNYNGSTDRSIYAYNTQSCYTNSELIDNMPFESGVLTYDLNNHCIDFVPDSDNVLYHVSIYDNTALATLKYTINDVETVIDHPASFNLPYYINGNPEKIEMNISVIITDTNSNSIGDATGQLYILNDELMPETPAIPDISIYKHDNRNVYIVPVYDNSILYESFICYSDNLTQDSNQTYGPYTYKIPTSGTKLRAGTYTLQTQVKLADYSPSIFTTFTIISTASGVTNHEVIEVS